MNESIVNCMTVNSVFSVLLSTRFMPEEDFELIRRTSVNSGLKKGESILKQGATIASPGFSS